MCENSYGDGGFRCSLIYPAYQVKQLSLRVYIHKKANPIKTNVLLSRAQLQSTSKVPLVIRSLIAAQGASSNYALGTYFFLIKCFVSYQ